MRDAIRSDRSPLGMLRAMLASLGYGKKSAAFDNAEQWTAPAGRVSVTIHAARNFSPATRISHRIGNLQVFEMPPGATVDERYLRLSPAELSILLSLARAQGEFVTLVDLSRSVKVDGPMSLRALTVHVYALRQKLAMNGASAMVTTKRMLGYKLSTDRDPN